MPARIDYLRDLRDNPGATAEEVQRRVQAPTLAAVETQFRKCASANLVECDERKPKRYTLTEKGVEELPKLEPRTASAIVKSNSGAIVESSAGARPIVVPSHADPVLSFLVRIGEQAKKFMVERQSAQPISPEEQSCEVRSPRIRAMLERIRAREEAQPISQNNPETEATEVTEAVSKVSDSDTVALYLARHELYSFGWSDRLFGEDNQARARVTELESRVGEEIAEQVKRLVSAEREIRDDLWSDGTEMLRRVFELRDALHLPVPRTILVNSHLRNLITICRSGAFPRRFSKLR